MNYFFTADTHFGHTNIIKYCNRPFSSVEEMDETLIQNWNSVVKKNDIVYHLGDFTFKGSKNNYASRLNGKKKLCRGNHDIKVSKQDFTEIFTGPVKIKVNDIQIWISHYAHKSWPGKHRGVKHLFAHSHGRIPSDGASFDIGVDVWDFTPLSLEKVICNFNFLEEYEKGRYDFEGELEDYDLNVYMENK